jgi:hypothetical protein
VVLTPRPLHYDIPIRRAEIEEGNGEGSSKQTQYESDVEWDEGKYRGYNWSLVVGDEDRNWEKLYQYRCVLDKSRLLQHENRELGKVGREKEMLVLINLRNFIRVRKRDEKRLDSWMSSVRFTEKHEVLDSQLTFGWLKQVITLLWVDRVLGTTEAEYTPDFICSMAEVHAK